MSAYTTLKTHIVSTKHLVKALADLGFANVEVHEQAQPLVGWLGDQREQRAEVIIRKKQVGFASNDIGFRRLPDGSYEAMISEFDSAKFNRNWLGKLSQRYAYHVAKDELLAQNFDLVEEEVDDNQTIRLTLRRMT